MCRFDTSISNCFIGGYRCDLYLTTMAYKLPSMKIGEKVRKLRELRDFSQEYMATQLGMTQQNYSAIENDPNEDVSVRRLKKIAQILDIQFNDLLNFDEKNIFNNYSQAEQFGIINNQYFEAERKLFQQQIEQYKAEVAYLREMLQKALGGSNNK